jgi:hypothetical protein
MCNYEKKVLIALTMVLTTEGKSQVIVTRHYYCLSVFILPFVKIPLKVEREILFLSSMPSINRDNWLFLIRVIDVSVYRMYRLGIV